MHIWSQMFWIRDCGSSWRKGEWPTFDRVTTYEAFGFQQSLVFQGSFLDSTRLPSIRCPCENDCRTSRSSATRFWLIAKRVWAPGCSAYNTFLFFCHSLDLTLFREVKGQLVVASACSLQPVEHDTGCSHSEKVFKPAGRLNLWGRCWQPTETLLETFEAGLLRFVTLSRRVMKSNRSDFYSVSP